MALCIITAYSANAFAQKKAGKSHQSIDTHKDAVTGGSVTVDGQRIEYKAIAGNIYLRNSKNDTTATMFYVAYIKNDVKDESTRPVTFLYNGGPDSAGLSEREPKRIFMV